MDLFGFPVEPVKQPKKKEPVAKAAAVPPSSVQAVEQVKINVSIPEPVAAIEEALPIPEPELIPEIIVALKEDVPVTTEPTAAAAASTKPRSSGTVKLAKVAGKRGRKSFREMDSEVDLVEVPEESVLQQKLYYSISEVAGWFKVNTSLLRFWENEFDILQPRKTRKGDRLFRVEDIKNLQLIYFLLRQRKFSIDGAKKYLKNNKQDADRQAQLVQSLTKFRSFLLELKTNIAS